MLQVMDATINGLDENGTTIHRERRENIYKLNNRPEDQEATSALDGKLEVIPQVKNSYKCLC